MTLLAAEALTLRHVTRHGPVTALRGVSFTVQAGERLAVIGRSGSGKTSLGRLLAGLPPFGAEVSGWLRWAGGAAPVAQAGRAGWRRHVAWLPQEAAAALHPQLRLGAQVAETAGTADGVAASLAEVELDAGFARRYPHEVSGGQAQRAALACALASSPALLIADEPTSALDAGTGEAILELLRARARDRGMALLLVTHDLRAAATCDRVVVLDDGRIVEDEAAETVLRAPASAAARALLAASCCAPTD